MKFKSSLFDEKMINRTLFRISNEIIEKNKGASDLVLIGVLTRGLPMAERIRKNIQKIEGSDVPTGSIDITLYRDDLSELSDKPIVNATSFDFDIKDKNVILLDDVIFTGRTVRAALDAILAIGRPKTIQLAVLVDRGHRELPIRADYVGKNVPTSFNEIIAVKFIEIDGVDGIDLLEL